MPHRAPGTVGALRRDAAARLAAAGVDSPDLDAGLLLAHALGLSAAALRVAGPDLVSPAGAASFAQMLAQRLAGVPVARILGEKEFWSLPFTLSPDTLVPRPDTETVVEAALDALKGRAGPLRVLDLGTGSGAILAAILVEQPAAWGLGIDQSPGAAAMARDNLARAGLSRRSAVLVGDWASAVDAPFDLVVSNPPYIPTGDIAGLAIDVRENDPMAALDGGPDGLVAYRAIIQEAPRLLAPGGVLVLELGIGQEAAVTALLCAAGLPPAHAARPDLGGVARALTANRP